MSRFAYRKAGPSGEGRTRYHVHVTDERGTRFLGTIEGKAGDWTLDGLVIPQSWVERFLSRETACRQLVLANVCPYCRGRKVIGHGHQARGCPHCRTEGT